MEHITKCSRDCETISDGPISKKELNSLKKIIGKNNFDKLNEIKSDVENPLKGSNRLSDGSSILTLLLTKFLLNSFLSQDKKDKQYK